MAPVNNGRALFNSVPEGFPEPGKTIVYDSTETIDLESVALNGGLLVKTLELSIDPYMRGRMREPSKKSYNDAFTIGKPLNGFGVGVVLRSEHSDFKQGDHVYGIMEHVQYQVLTDTKTVSKCQNPANLPWSTFIGVLGMPGQTAYMAWKEYSKAQKGEVAFVSTGAGPVGSFVIQLAKLDGLRVIASAGSDEKVQYMKEIGADVAFNYKTTNTAEVLEKEGGIDIFWDNVGGETLEAALEAAHVGARFIECGMISAYNNNGKPIRNIFHVIPKSLSINGFIVSRLFPKYLKEFYTEVPPLVVSGKIQHREHVWNGLDKVGEAIEAVQRGTNKAKAVIHVADE